MAEGARAGAEHGDIALLAALQLGDAFLPTGAYTLSQGLESLVQLRWVTTASELEAALTAYLAEQLAPADGVAVANAHRAAARGDLAEVLAIDRHLLALKLPREVREGAQRTGRNLLQAVGPTVEDAVLAAYARAVAEGAAPGTYAVALGVVARALGLTARAALLVYFYASTVGLLGAALRLMRLDHLAAQGILARLRPQLAALAAAFEARPWEAMRAFGPQWEVASMTHERARVRLFTS
ncbi:MAG TPA: urease accessory UreF family protein [Chloroflexota bacterium]|nr:urease accessory UreF family protein [Chloroflexota bacterium]HZU08187.1 urease accessory UreF family protein [Chloroflexota bacterium]